MFNEHRSLLSYTELMSSDKRANVARNAQQKSAVRKVILVAAREIVVQKGFAALSIRKLAEAVGYAPGTIYLYFKNRDALTREICLQGFAELSAQMDLVVTADPQERLTALLNAYANFALENPETYRLSFMEDPRFAEEMMRAAPLEGEGGAGRRAFNLLVEAVQALKQSGKIRAEEDETLLAELFWTGIHGVVSLKLIYPAFPSTPTDVLVGKMIESLLASLSV